MANNIKIIKGNIFNSQTQTIVNTVNCVGVMGKGIALVYKLRYPNLFEKYQELCKKRLIDIGKLWLYKEETDAPWVLNFPTKKHWKYPSQYSYIEAGLQKFVDTYKEKGIKSIAFPLLGANNGGLDSDKVLNLMTTYLSQCDIPIEIYLYDATARDDLFDCFKLKWNSIPENQRKLITGIRMQKQINIISDALNSDDIKSLIALIEYPGIGSTTMQKCFTLVMSCQKQHQPGLFDTPEDENTTLKAIASAIKVIGKIDLSKFERKKKEIKSDKRNLYIIDTNVFVNCPDIISKIEPEYPVILSAKVVNELDKMKIKLSEQDKKNAEKALRLLNQESSCEIIFETGDTSLLPDDYDKRSPDNMILSVALKYKDENPIMLTSDNGLQLKSKILGITTISLKAFLRQLKQ